MDIKDLNKSQLILLALLLSFVTSIMTGIVTVTLLDQNPDSVSTPITRVVKQTIERVVSEEGKGSSTLTEEQTKLLESLQVIKPLEVSLFLNSNGKEKLLGAGVFLGENKAVISKKVETISLDDKNFLLLKSALGERRVEKITNYDTFSIVELKMTSEQVKEDVENNVKENDLTEQQNEIKPENTVETPAEN